MGSDRRSIRLPEHDYAEDSGYFVTICVQDRVCLFGDVVGGEMVLNELGAIVRDEWERTAVVRPYVTIDTYMIMPNHFHGILVINHGYEAGRVGATWQVAPTNTNVPRQAKGPIKGSLGAIIGQFKRITTIRINEHRNTPSAKVWQRNYYEHVIRTEENANDIRLYIEINPARWAEDAENPANWARR